MAKDITVNPSNSPYKVPGPTADYGTVTIEPGGVLQFDKETTMTVTTLTKDNSKLK